MRALCLLVLAMLGPASPAWAHAALERAVPPVGSQVDQPPRQVVLTFTEGVEPAFSTCTARSFWDTGLNPMPRWRVVEVACHGIPSA